MKQRAIELFEKGVELEDAGDKNAAIEAYEEALIADPLLAAAHINLGTIYFHMRHYASAEGEYRRATEIDGEYALAFFNLGNVLDEVGRWDEAISNYARAILIAPDYADPHYNVEIRKSVV